MGNVPASDPLARARAYCARQERAQQEVRDKLHAWGLRTDDVEEVLARLISEGFLNEARFAEHYAVSKLRQKGWGRRKIEAGLRTRQVSEACIRVALAALDRTEYVRQLEQAVQRQWERLLGTPAAMRRHKVMRHFLARGFEAHLVEQALRERD